MKLLKPLIISLICSFILSACSKPAEFEYLDGEPGFFDDLKGQWTVVNYWAEWCKPCIKEIPELNQLDAKYDDIQVIGINFDKPPRAQLQQQADKLKVAFRNVLLSESTKSFVAYFQYEKPMALPTTIIIAPDLSVQKILRGPQDEAALAAEVDALKHHLQKADQ